MSWGLFILILIIFVAFTALLFLQIPNFGANYAEVYFIVLVIILFIILLFAIDFSNPISATITIQNTAKKQNPIIYDIPYNADASYSNIFSASFAGTWSTDTDPTNKDASKDIVIFNYDTLTAPVQVLGTTNKIVITKLPNYQIQIDIDPTVDTAHNIDGFLTISLLCTSAQSINSRIDLVSS